MVDFKSDKLYYPSKTYDEPLDIFWLSNDRANENDEK